MASVNDYLKKLLYQYDCVVVPALGAFLTHYQPASFTESSGLFLPPRKRVAFNEALRVDDGILANYIMLHEPVTREGAQRYISQFVDELRRQVVDTDRFEIDGVGTFTQNDEQKLQFEPSLRHNFFGDSYGMSAISAHSLTIQALDPVVISPAPMAIGPVLVRDPETTLMPLIRSRPYWRVAAAALLIGSLGFVSYFSVIRPGQPQQSSLDPGALLRTSSALLGQLDRLVEQKTVRSAISTTVAPPIPASPATAVKAPEASAVVPTSAPIQQIVTTPTPPAETISADQPARTTPYFTVIAGSFSSRRNALKLKRQLRKAGYADAFVMAPTQKGQLYKVAASGSAIREEAVASAGAVSELAGAEAWIHKN